MGRGGLQIFGGLQFFRGVGGVSNLLGEVSNFSIFFPQIKSSGMYPPPLETVNAGPVHILLECILVSIVISGVNYIFAMSFKKDIILIIICYKATDNKHYLCYKSPATKQFAQT